MILNALEVIFDLKSIGMPTELLFSLCIEGSTINSSFGLGIGCWMAVLVFGIFV